MLGALSGDVIGSMIEYRGIKTKDFLLFDRFNNFTDDSVLTLALADALINNTSISDKYVEWGVAYLEKDYGLSFRYWLTDVSHTPYNSFGNGSAMRVGFIPYIAKDIADAEALAIQSALPSHNHPEGIKGACATAVSARMALEGYSKDDIKETITKYYGYDLNRTLDNIRPSYKYEISCQKSVPESIIAFLESENFEDAIRNTISLGGDADTMASITGAIAYPFYKNDISFNIIWEEILSKKIFDDRCLITINQFLDNYSQRTYVKSNINLMGLQNNYVSENKDTEIITISMVKNKKKNIINKMMDIFNKRN